MFRPLFVVLVVEFTLISTFVNSHNESGEWSCESSDSGTQLVAGFRPGVITLDGHPDDWKDVNGFDFSLFPALDPHEDDAYKNGKMNVKVCVISKFLALFYFFFMFKDLSFDGLCFCGILLVSGFILNLFELIFDVKF